MFGEFTGVVADATGTFTAETEHDDGIVVHTVMHADRSVFAEVYVPYDFGTEATITACATYAAGMRMCGYLDLIAEDDVSADLAEIFEYVYIFCSGPARVRGA